MLGAGDLGAAREESRQALALSRKTSGQTFRYEAVLAHARVQARSGQPARARKELEATLVSVRQFGYRLYEFQVRLALGEVALRSGAASARRDLARLQNDARSHGALLAASEAQALLTENQTK